MVLATQQQVVAQESLNASQSGRRLETFVEQVFVEVGILVSRELEAVDICQASVGSPAMVARNANYQTVFGHDARIEFILSLGGKCYLIETKRQTVGGSIDEKMPYVFLNAQLNIDRFGFILVLEGQGMKPEARKWIETQARDLEGFEVLSFEGFKIWLSAHMR